VLGFSAKVMKCRSSTISSTGSQRDIAHLFKVVSRLRPPVDPKQRRSDVAKAKNTPGWEPAVLLRDGLVSTIEYSNEFPKEQAGT
jgi:nucleoside-diphosphate-sugar epimerase